MEAPAVIPKTPARVVCTLVLAWLLVAPFAVVWSGRSHTLWGPWSVFDERRRGCNTARYLPFEAAILRNRPERGGGDAAYSVVWAGKPGFEAAELNLDGRCVGSAWLRSGSGTWGVLAPVASHEYQRAYISLTGNAKGDEAAVRKAYVSAIARLGTIPSLTPQRAAEFAENDLSITRIDPLMLLYDIAVPLTAAGLAGMAVNGAPVLRARLRRRTRGEILLACRCPRCDYDTSGMAERCPECGEWLTVDGAAPMEGEPRA